MNKAKTRQHFKGVMEFGTRSKEETNVAKSTTSEKQTRGQDTKLHKISSQINHKEPIKVLKNIL